jgi:oligopeptide/dipeptide ABC transporter ATP-binding protein
VTAIVKANDLTKHFPGRADFFGRSSGTVRAVDGVSFAIEAGTTLGIVGESGCGKTTLAKLVLGLERPTSGSLHFEDQDIAALDRAGWRHYRRNVQAVLQDPYSSLNPRLRVSTIVGEPIQVNEKRVPGRKEARVRKLLDLVGLPRRAFDQFPHEFSGGQRQRIAIARALALSPKLIVLDEPVSALDMSIRAQILNLLIDLQHDLNLAYLFIAHDLAAVTYLSHQIVVMYLGKVVESGDAERIAFGPGHPYAQALFAAALPGRPGAGIDEPAITGELPDPTQAMTGCRFQPRCPVAAERCRTDEPLLLNHAHHRVACHLYKGDGDDSPAAAN